MVKEMVGDAAMPASRVATVSEAVLRILREQQVAGGGGILEQGHLALGMLLLLLLGLAVVEGAVLLHGTGGG